MEITLNHEQALFVFKGEDRVTYMGYDVVYKSILELHRRIRKLRLLPAGIELMPALESEIGTLKQYEQYRDMLGIVGNRKIGTWFDYDTPGKVRNILEQYRKEGGRLRIFYFTMTPAPNFAGLRRSPIQQVYQWVRRVQHMTVLSET
jgi:hypothetical protein